MTFQNGTTHKKHDDIIESCAASVRKMKCVHLLLIVMVRVLRAVHFTHHQTFLTVSKTATDYVAKPATKTVTETVTTQRAGGSVSRPPHFK